MLSIHPSYSRERNISGGNFITSVAVRCPLELKDKLEFEFGGSRLLLPHKKTFFDITNKSSYAFCDHVLVMLILSDHVKTELIV